jgi:hypothetical protein
MVNFIKFIFVIELLISEHCAPLNQLFHVSLHRGYILVLVKFEFQM